jgi:hypothetical protein
MKVAKLTHKERPVFFPEHQIHPIVIGEKTLTIKAVTPQPTINFDVLRHDQTGPIFSITSKGVSNLRHTLKCPFGVPGDLLYVRETWFFDPNDLCLTPTWTTYRASPGVVLENVPCWFSPVSMPKKLARIWLKITEVKLDRIQNINANTLIKEDPSLKENSELSPLLLSYKDSLRSYWNSRCKIGFDQNPWVWVISFELEKILG